jgi:hypothetical protein
METKKSRSIVANPKKLRSNAWIDRDGPGRSIIRRACPVLDPIIARTDKHDVRYHPTNRASRQDRRRLHRQGRQRQVHDGLAPARQQVRIARLATSCSSSSSSSFWGHPSNGSRSSKIATPFEGITSTRPVRERVPRRNRARCDGSFLCASIPRIAAVRAAPRHRTGPRSLDDARPSPPLLSLWKGSGCFYESALVKPSHGFSLRGMRLVYILITHMYWKTPALPR